VRIQVGRCGFFHLSLFNWGNLRLCVLRFVFWLVKKADGPRKWAITIPAGNNSASLAGHIAETPAIQEGSAGLHGNFTC
jgi:hypothetical protein